jgi:D-alanyl-D-alanine carboxypeptidase (penicillin-binding protein 5/6)
MPELPALPVKNGIRDAVRLKYRDSFSYLGFHGEDFGAIEKELQLEEMTEAPVTEGDVLGYLVYKLDSEEIGRVAVTAAEDVREAGYLDYLKRLGGSMWL